MKKLYSLEVNGQEIVSVEMDVPDFMPNPQIDRKWLKGIVTEEVSQVVQRSAKSHRKPARAVRHVRSRPRRAVKVAA